ncbi:MAG: PIG-L family deacetylase [Ignavibacteria bacterium]|nr:PIG-L family deacetylase [Ignavibacteria bacterium]
MAMTRGEGGQNLIGPEQGELMGMIRTQELLAARRIDGAEQLFTRAIDFGYSKNSEETLRMWGRERTLSDVVWIIRKFRPDVVISRFTPTLGGHGNHTASAILVEEAFHAARDPSRFPEQLRDLSVWHPRRLVWNVFRFRQNEPIPTNLVTLDVGTYTPLLGRSFTEIAGLSRSMHKSQGFGAAENRGSLLNYFQHVAGDSARGDLFDGIDLGWSRVKGGETVGRLLEEANGRFNPLEPSSVLPVLLKAYAELQKLSDSYWVDLKRTELLDVIKACSGLWIDALAADYLASPTLEVRLTVMLLNRSSFPVTVRSIAVPLGQKDSVLNVQLATNRSTQVPLSFRLPDTVPYSQPYWLLESPERESYHVLDQHLIGMPENPPAAVANVSLLLNDVPLELEIPVRYRWVDPVEGELYRPFLIAPAVMVNIRQNVTVFADLKTKEIEVSLRSGGAEVSGSVYLEVPKGWKVMPDRGQFELTEKSQEQVITFQITPTDGAMSGVVRAVAETNGRRMIRGIQTIEYKHIPPQVLFPLAEGKLVRIDVQRRGQNVAYIMGAGDEIPAALRQVGYALMLLSDEDIKGSDLSRFDAIIAGVRAYNTRAALRLSQKRFLEYVEKGGTYLVQYVTTQRGESENIGPYPFNVSRERVTVEEAPVSFVNPGHPILTVPNRITERDFEGWIQERGLYFADKWDPKYATVVASNDPGEEKKEGGLLVTRYGKGYYIYTGYAFFRQLPAGVPGAYRLFVNMISIGK